MKAVPISSRWDGLRERLDNSLRWAGGGGEAGRACRPECLLRENQSPRINEIFRNLILITVWANPQWPNFCILRALFCFPPVSARNYLEVIFILFDTQWSVISWTFSAFSQFIFLLPKDYEIETWSRYNKNIFRVSSLLPTWVHSSQQPKGKVFKKNNFTVFTMRVSPPASLPCSCWVVLVTKWLGSQDYIMSVVAFFAHEK